jgi:hypothetical protein
LTPEPQLDDDYARDVDEISDDVWDLADAAYDAMRDDEVLAEYERNE